MAKKRYKHLHRDATGRVDRVEYSDNPRPTPEPVPYSSPPSLWDRFIDWFFEDGLGYIIATIICLAILAGLCFAAYSVYGTLRRWFGL